MCPSQTIPWSSSASHYDINWLFNHLKKHCEHLCDCKSCCAFNLTFHCMHSWHFRDRYSTRLPQSSKAYRIVGSLIAQTCRRSTWSISVGRVPWRSVLLTNTPVLMGYHSVLCHCLYVASNGTPWHWNYPPSYMDKIFTVLPGGGGFFFFSHPARYPMVPLQHCIILLGWRPLIC